MSEGGNGQRLPVPVPQLLETLEQTAIDHNAPAMRLDQVFRAGYRAGAAKEGDLVGHEKAFACFECLTIK